MLRLSSKIFSILITCSALYPSVSHGYLPNFETTRTQSLAGAGVASLLINESSILNPASIAFFNQSTLYYQKTDSDFRNNDSRSQVLLLTDTSSTLKGGVSLITQNDDDNNKRTRISGSMASNIGKNNSFGLIYRYSDEKSDLRDEVYQQIVLGYTHIYNEALTFGATIVDPSQEIKEQFHFTLGVQYIIFTNLALLLDVGSGDTQNYDDESFVKTAIQLQSFKRFYLRYGQFEDKMTNLKGHSWGASWVGPKFSIDYGHKNAQTIDSDFDFIEQSLSLTVLF